MIERIGYCITSLSTWCTDPAQVETVKVEWLSGITEEVRYVEELPVAHEILIKGKGYYRLVVTLKKQNPPASH